MNQISPSPLPTQENSLKSLGDLFRPLRWMLLIFCIVLSISYFASSTDDDSVYEILNFVIPATIFFCGTFFGLLIAMTHPNAIWSPIFWALVSSGFYFGLGALYIFSGDEYGFYIIERRFSLEPYDIWRANVSNLVGMFCFVTTVYVAGHWFSYPSENKKDSSEDQREEKEIKRIFWLFFLIGGSIKYFLVVPHNFGWSKFMLPGAIMSMGEFFLVSVMLLSFLATKKRGIWLALLLFLLCLDGFVNLLSFSKTALLRSLLFVVLGVFLAQRRIKVLLVGGVILIAFYISIKTFIGEGRLVLIGRGVAVGATYEDRLDAVRIASEKTQNEDETEDLEHLRFGWWYRLFYTPIHARLMSDYDSGQPGFSLEGMSYAWIPRVIWPEKPVISDVGLELTDKLFGYRSSSTGIGLFGELYWNGGYWAIFFASVYIGLLFLTVSRISFWVLENRVWLFWPLVLFGVQWGVNFHSWFVATYIGSLAMFVSFFIMFYFIRIGFRLFGELGTVRRGN